MSNPIDKLWNQPIFRMSLGSKELFHSDFLQWLCQSYPAQMTNVFRELLADPTISIDRCHIYREVQHIDLTIGLNAITGDEQTSEGDCDDDGPRPTRFIYIENKVKSQPSVEQIREYDAKITEWRRKRKNRHGDENQDIRVLLSLLPPSFDLGGDNDEFEGRWRLLKYGQLANSLRQHLSSFSSDDAYRHALISDYVDMVENLVAVTKDAQVNFDSGTCEFLDSGVYHRYKRARIHDLYYKLIFDQIGQHIRDLVRVEEFGDGMVQILSMEDLVIETGMTRAKGFVHFALPILNEPRVTMGVQVQHNAFRLFVEAPTEEAARACVVQLATTPTPDQAWLNFTQLGNVMPIRHRYDICGFKGTDKYFAYRYECVYPTIRIGRLIEHILFYLNAVIDRQDELRQIVANRL